MLGMVGGGRERSRQGKGALMLLSRLAGSSMVIEIDED